MAPDTIPTTPHGLVPPKDAAGLLTIQGDIHGNTEPSRERKGRTAYGRYRAHQGGVAYSGQPIPEYEALRPDIRDAWDDLGEFLYQWGYNRGSSATAAEYEDD